MYTHFFKFHRRLPQGQTLLEAVIAIGVILVGVVGTLVLVNTTIALGRANQDRLVGQNLAREGLELTYSLRNDGALRRLEDPSFAWNSYITAQVPKTSNIDEYKKKYDLGDIKNGSCRQYDKSCTTPSSCTDEHNDLDAGSGVDQTAALDCDILALENYLFSAMWPLPPGCAGAFGSGGSHLDNAPAGCNYATDGNDQVDIGDLVALIQAVKSASYTLNTAYPTVAMTGSPNGRLFFYDPLQNAETINDTSGEVSNPEKAWSITANSQVMQYGSGFIQNVTPPAGPTQPTPTKFFRLVTVQSVCAAKYSAAPYNGAYRQVVLPSSVALSCNDYITHQVDGNIDTNWDKNTTTLVGALVTSEVRWPTYSSATKARYQEFLYDWITA